MAKWNITSLTQSGFQPGSGFDRGALGLGCIFLPESSGFLYFPFRTPVFDRNLDFRSAVILYIGIKRSKNLRSKTKTMGRDLCKPRVPSGTVLRLAIIKLQADTRFRVV